MILVERSRENAAQEKATGQDLTPEAVKIDEVPKKCARPGPGVVADLKNKRNMKFSTMPVHASPSV